MRKSYLLTVTTFFFYSTVFSQWINFTEQTAERIVITNVNDNDDPSNMDDMEKDLVIGDFNNDSFMDLVVVRKVPFSTPGAKTDLLLMNEDGVLVDRTDVFAPDFLSTSTDARDVICVDVNMDDWMDLFVINTFGEQPKLFINRGNDGDGNWLGFIDESNTRLPILTFGLIQYCAGWSGDLTQNGSPDIYMVNYDPVGPALDALFINDGTGNFTEESQTRLGDLRNSSFGTGTEIHDIDNDGDLDIIKNLGLNPIAPFNERGTIALYNNGDGTFTNWQKFPGMATYMFSAGDLNDDGFLDFYEVDDFQDYVNFITAVTPDANVTINQDFLTSNRTDVWGGNVKMVDLDGDGDLDVSIASVDTDEPPCDTSTDMGQPGGVRVFALFENEGLHSGNLIDPYNNNDQDWHISNYDQDFIDINNDGMLDIIFGACEGYRVFMQEPLLSIEEISLDQVISIYPNPNQGLMNVTFSTLDISAVTIEVYTLNGKLFKTASKEILLNNTVILDLRGYATSGIYFLKFITNQGTLTQKVIIR